MLSISGCKHANSLKIFIKFPIKIFNDYSGVIQITFIRVGRKITMSISREQNKYKDLLTREIQYIY